MTFSWQGGHFKTSVALDCFYQIVSLPYTLFFSDFFINPKFLCGNVFPLLQFSMHNGPTIFQHVPPVAALNEIIFCTANLLLLVTGKRNSSCIDTCHSCYCSVPGCGEIRQPKVSFFSCMTIVSTGGRMRIGSRDVMQQTTSVVCSNTNGSIRNQR